jgi:release factor glutamine methyltransferase
MAMRPSEVVRRSADYLARHGVESPRETAEVLLMSVLGVDRAGMYARGEGLDTAHARAFGRALCRRCKGTPLQHLTGEQQFMALTLTVRPGVFVPRPETERVAEVALACIAAVSRPVVVDVGTGTGAIALAIRARRPDARVVATDVSEAAVDLARSNARRLGLAVDVRLGDLLDPLPSELRGSIDLTVSNPPYVEAGEYDDLSAEVRADPVEALVGGTEVHARLAEAALEWLSPGGRLVMEIGDAQARAVRSILEVGYVDVEVLQELTGRDRIVRGRRPTA